MPTSGRAGGVIFTLSGHVGPEYALLDLAEPGLDLPAGRVVLDDLLDAEGEVRGEQRDPLGLVIDPPTRTRQRKVLSITMRSAAMTSRRAP